MRMTYTALRAKPRVLQSMTGLTVSEFEALLPSFARAYQAFIDSAIRGTVRQRSYGGGRTPELQSIEDKLLFV